MEFQHVVLTKLKNLSPSANLQAALDSFIESTFNPANYSSGACVARDVDGKPLVILPDAFGRKVFLPSNILGIYQATSRCYRIHCNARC